MDLAVTGCDRPTGSMMVSRIHAQNEFGYHPGPANPMLYPQAARVCRSGQPAHRTNAYPLPIPACQRPADTVELSTPWESNVWPYETPALRQQLQIDCAYPHPPDNSELFPSFSELPIEPPPPADIFLKGHLVDILI